MHEFLIFLGQTTHIYYLQFHNQKLLDVTFAFKYTEMHELWSFLGQTTYINYLQLHNQKAIDLYTSI